MSSNWEGYMCINCWRFWMGSVDSVLLLFSTTTIRFHPRFIINNLALTTTFFASRQVKYLLNSIKSHVQSVTSITFIWLILSLLPASSTIHATKSNDFYVAFAFMLMLWKCIGALTIVLLSIGLLLIFLLTIHDCMILHLF